MTLEESEGFFGKEKKRSEGEEKGEGKDEKKDVC